MICYGTCPVLSCLLPCGTLEGRAVPSSTLVPEEELGPGQASGMEGGGGGGGFLWALEEMFHSARSCYFLACEISLA